MAVNADRPGGLFMRRSFIMHHCFAVVWRRSLEPNTCRVKFFKNQGVASWQRRRRARKRKQKRARELRLETLRNRQAAGLMFGRLSFLLPPSSQRTMRAPSFVSNFAADLRPGSLS